jgi:hypothetical protein
MSTNKAATVITDDHPQVGTGSDRNRSAVGSLMAYSKGLLSRQEAVRRLGLRDYADLLVALGDAGLSMPLAPADEIGRQAGTFAKLWKMG